MQIYVFFCRFSKRKFRNFAAFPREIGAILPLLQELRGTTTQGGPTQQLCNYGSFVAIDVVISLLKTDKIAAMIL